MVATAIRWLYGAIPGTNYINDAAQVMAAMAQFQLIEKQQKLYR